MPCRIPSHIFDIDEYSAERLRARLADRRRMRKRLQTLGTTIAVLGAIARLLW